MTIDPGTSFIVPWSEATISASDAKKLRELSPAGILIGKSLCREVEGNTDRYLQRMQGLIHKLQDVLDRERLLIVRPLDASLLGLPNSLSTLSESFIQSAPEREQLLAACKIVAAQGVTLLLGPRIDRMLHEGNVSRTLFDAAATELHKLKIASCPGVFPLTELPEQVPEYPAPMIQDGEASYETIVSLFEPWIELFPQTLMLGNVFYPSFDERFPISSSRYAYETMLQRHLHFSGVSIATFPSRSLQKAYATEDTLLLETKRAGLDLWIYTEERDALAACLSYKKALIKRAKTDELLRLSIDQSLGRIERLLMELRIPEVSIDLVHEAEKVLKSY